MCEHICSREYQMHGTINSGRTLDPFFKNLGVLRKDEYVHNFHFSIKSTL